MTDPTPDAIAAELVAAGLLVISTDDEGRETWTLTAEGAQLGRALAMGEGEEALDTLLGGSRVRATTEVDEDG